MIRLVQWYNEAEELADLYYLSIRLGIEKKAEELNIQIRRETLNDLSDTQVSGTIALGKFDAEQIRQLRKVDDKDIKKSGYFLAKRQLNTTCSQSKIHDCMHLKRS